MFPYVQRSLERYNKVQCRVQESMAYIFTLGTRMTSVTGQTDSCINIVTYGVEGMENAPALRSSLSASQLFVQRVAKPVSQVM